MGSYAEAREQDDDRLEAMNKFLAASGVVIGAACQESASGKHPSSTFHQQGAHSNSLLCGELEKTPPAPGGGSHASLPAHHGNGIAATSTPHRLSAWKGSRECNGRAGCGCSTCGRDCKRSGSPKQHHQHGYSDVPSCPPRQLGGVGAPEEANNKRREIVREVHWQDLASNGLTGKKGTGTQQPHKRQDPEPHQASMKGKGKLPQPRQDPEPYQSSDSSASYSDFGTESHCCPEESQQIQLCRLWRAYKAADDALGGGPIAQAMYDMYKGALKQKHKKEPLVKRLQELKSKKEQTRASLQAIARNHALVEERAGQLLAKQRQYLLAAADLEVVYAEQKEQMAMLVSRIRKLPSTLHHERGQMGSELRRAGWSRAEDLAQPPKDRSRSPQRMPTGSGSSFNHSSMASTQLCTPGQY